MNVNLDEVLVSSFGRSRIAGIAAQKSDRELEHHILKRAGRYRKAGMWSHYLVRTWRMQREGGAVRNHIVHLARVLADDLPMRESFEAMYRLNGGVGAAKFLKQLVEAPVIPLAPEERKARVRAGIAKKVDKREAHAKKMYAKHMAALGREERAVDRWHARVAYYARKAGEPQAPPKRPQKRRRRRRGSPRS